MLLERNVIDSIAFFLSVQARCMLQRVIRKRANASISRKMYVRSINNINK